MGKLQEFSVAFLIIYFIASLCFGIAGGFSEILEFPGDDSLYGLLPLVGLFLSGIMISLSFKISENNLLLKISYWINIVLVFIPLMLLARQNYACQIGRCIGYEMGITMAIGIIISGIFIIISFILFAIGYRRQMTVSKS